MSGREATVATIPGECALSIGKPDLPAPKGWSWLPLLEVARLESGHTPSRQHPEYWDGDVPWIGIRDARLHHGRRIGETLQTVTEEGLANSAARWLPKDTVCLSRTASVGYVTILDRPMATSQDFVNWICSDALDPDFLMRLFMAEDAYSAHRDRLDRAIVIVPIGHRDQGRSEATLVRQVVEVSAWRFLPAFDGSGPWA